MRKWLILCLLLVIVAITACQKENHEENTELIQPVEENENVDNDENDEIAYANIYPLTGIGTNDSVDHRIVGVMINNHHAARPQSGVSHADIVFEILAEGSITRWLALFHSEQPDMVGPVRSAREYYFDLTERYDGLYVYHGAADVVEETLRNRGIDRLNGSIYDNDGYLFTRESFRNAPHNSYLHFNHVYDVAEDKGYDIIRPVAPLEFLNPDEAVDGEQASHVTLMYPGRSEASAIEFIYDEIQGHYERSENGEKTVAYESNEPLTFDNILILETPHEIIDQQGRRAIDLTSGGQAFLLQKGKINEVEWANDDGRIVPIKNGEQVGFMPGKTWINVMPSNPGLGQSVIIKNE